MPKVADAIWIDEDFALKYRGICNTCLNKGRSLVNDDDENATYEYITTLVKVQIKGNTCVSF